MGEQPQTATALRRVAAFLVGAACLQAGPILDQAFQTNVPLLKGWQMFHRKGSQLCDARFEIRLDDGESRSVRPADVLTASGGEPGTRYRIATPKQARELAQRYCTRVSPPGELRGFVRCGDPWKGWVMVMSGENDLCEDS